MRDSTSPTVTLSAAEAAEAIMALIMEELDDGIPEAADDDIICHVSESWHWWDFITPSQEARRAAWDIDTGRHSGLSLIADLEGVEVMLEVVAMEVL